ncbi:MAG TPA: translation initiation factor IF-3 [Chitinophagales bacterium]|nr:translation initiation factor IF-3 [Chitinophagales bacterium]
MSRPPINTNQPRTPYNRRLVQREKEPEHRLNDMIRVPEVRLVGENIEPGIYSIHKALALADELEADLVEIVPNATPPVCRIIDYNKFLYEKKRKEKEIKAKTIKTVVKEIRFGPNTDEHDFEFKTRHAEKFLRDEGAKVKATLSFKGRAIIYKDRGEQLLLRFAQALEEVGTPEAPPRLEGKRMYIIITPKKK